MDTTAQLRPRAELLAILDKLVAEEMAKTPPDVSSLRWLSPLSEAAERIRADARPPAPTAGMAGGDVVAQYLRWAQSRGTDAAAGDYSAFLAGFAAARSEPPAAGVVEAPDLDALCKPWEFCTGDPPDDDSPLQRVFVAGMLYTEGLLAKLLDVKRYEPGDGSEDFDFDATQSLSNILIEAKLYDPEDGSWAALAAPPSASGAGG